MSEPSAGAVAVVVTGDTAADDAAHRWAHWRAEAEGLELRSVRLADLAEADVRIAVIGRHGEGGDAEDLLALARSLPVPLVVVTATPDRPDRPAPSELLDPPGGAVVVGVPAQSDATALLDAAGAEAVVAGTDLHLVRVWGESGWFGSMTRAAAPVLQDLRESDRARLDAAALHVHHRFPDLDVTARLGDGGVAEWLAALPGGTRLLAIGPDPADGTGTGAAAWALRHLQLPVLLAGAAPHPTSGADRAAHGGVVSGV